MVVDSPAWPMMVEAEVWVNDPGSSGEANRFGFSYRASLKATLEAKPAILINPLFEACRSLAGGSGCRWAILTTPGFSFGGRGGRMRGDAR